MRFGGVNAEIAHPVLNGMVKLIFAVNIAGILILWGSFRLLSVFTNIDQPYFSALVWFFIFGLIYAFFALLFFGLAKLIERQKVGQALTHNRRYEWHSSYNTDLTEAEMNKIPETQVKPAESQAVNAGLRYFRIAKLLVFCSLVTCVLGFYTFYDTMIAN
jgi:hypothetical protein